MRRTFSILFFLSFIMTLTSSTIAQTKPSLDATIRKGDSLFWQAYNTCDTGSFRKYLMNDVEFYHDKGGSYYGVEALVNSLKQNLCSRTNFRLRRDPVPATIQVYPMEKNGEVYAAIITGDHKFFISEDGKPFRESGNAKFTHLWLRNGNEWKMSRILSYEHKAAD